mgnify:FL=1
MNFEKSLLFSLEKYLELPSELTSVASDPENPGFDAALVIAELLSVSGCIFNIIITLLLGLQRNVLGKMMIFLSVNDLFFHIGLRLAAEMGILSPFSDILLGFSWAGSVSWISCFAHALYVSVKFGEELLNNSLLKKHITSSLTVSTLGGGVFAIFPLMGYSPEFSFLDYSFMALLAILSTIFCGFCYISVLKQLWRYEAKIHLELLLYPLFLIICEFPFVIIQLYSILSAHLAPSTLRDTAFLCLMSRGLWNSLAYGLSSKIRNGFKTLCRKNRRERQQELLEKGHSSSGHMEHRKSDTSVSSIETPSFVLRFGINN